LILLSDRIGAAKVNLSDYLTEDRVLMLRGRSKAEAIAELAGVLGREDLGFSAEQLAEAIVTREALMSTGIGQGLAVPHVRLPGANAAAVAVGVSAEGIADYDSLDNQPVHLVVMIVAPAGEHETYLRLLAEIARIVKDPALRRRIIHETDAPALYCLLVGAGS